ncbi:N-acetylglucosamine-6-phosphate deacetylase [Shewanella sedimentimangrovi]|uniref:N-acetylgalactosamine-6-phosphate deacetylase n=2 Tax=Shewanella sedimentimangrovi TaxID=2814293 RepID=A0ABX7R3P6_9GAMM|nr:N-acetylglucosamine-6-phosphate deacetylase [Shewanella sedimentimangrovi]
MPSILQAKGVLPMVKPGAYWLCPARALLGENMDEVSRPWLRLANGKITQIATSAPDSAEPVFECDGLLVPALIDTQVNGGGGILFNHSPTAETLGTMLDAHGRYGTATLLPTVISDDVAVMSAALDAAIEARRLGFDGVAGIHFEGPHLSVTKRGCHSVGKLRPLGESELALYGRAVRELGACLVTLAPERVEPSDIRDLVALGVKVSLGHSDCDFATAMQAINAGARGFTHLFNGMSGLTSREPGMLGAALYSAQSCSGIILDGEHVHPASAMLAWRLKGRRGLMLVTDAMSTVGTDTTEFAFFGGKVVRRGNALRDSNGSLAGSLLTMTGALRYACQTMGIAVADAVAMATHTPAQFMGFEDRGALVPGARADLLLLDDKLFQCARWQSGVVVAGAEPGAGLTLPLALITGLSRT